MSELTDIVGIGSVSTTAAVALMKNPELLKMIYNDVASPSVQKVGRALETVFGLSNTLLLPLKLINETTAALFQKHMEQYRARLEEIPDDCINNVSAEIGIPLLDRLTYIEDENISSMFVNLLHNASVRELAATTHPLSINIVGNLSPDEALLLSNFVKLYFEDEQLVIPYSWVKVFHGNTRNYHVENRYLLLNSVVSGLTFPENIHIYIENLRALGLVAIEPDKAISDTLKYYGPISNQYSSLMSSIRESAATTGNDPRLINGLIALTETGKFFVKSVGLIPKLDIRGPAS